MFIFALKSNTYAQKAKRILLKYNISSEIVRLEPFRTKNGCSYGIKIFNENLYNVQSIFNQNSIQYSEILKE